MVEDHPINPAIVAGTFLYSHDSIPLAALQPKRPNISG